MSKMDDFENALAQEYQAKRNTQEEQVDNAIIEFLKAMQGVDRITLLQALEQIKDMSNEICFLKIPNEI